MFPYYCDNYYYNKIWKLTHNYLRLYKPVGDCYKMLARNLIEIQNDVIPPICFLTHPKQWALPEKTDELDPIFFL